MGKNIRSLQLLRNTDLFNDKAAAIAGIQSGATNDGTVKLARYKEEVTSGETKVEVIKTVFGICYNPSEDTTSGATGFSYTIYDSPQEVITALEGRIKANENAIAKLNDVDTVSGSVANSIKTAIDKLDVDAVGGAGQVITAISEADGKISATASDLTAGIVAATAITSGDTTIAVTGETVAAQIASLAQYIGSLDVNDTAVIGSYVSAVSETDGKITVTRAELPTVHEITSDGQAIVAVREFKGIISARAGDIAAAHVTIADGSNHFSGDTVQAALEELYSQASSGSEVTVSEAEGTEDGVLKVYTITQGGEEVGKINIPKDLVVTSGSVVKGNWVDGVFTESASGTGTALKLVIANQTTPVYINTLDLVKDHTAGNGIAISNTNVVSVVVDSSSEFLSVGTNGVKVSGVKTYVGEEIAKLSGETTSSGGSHVTVKVKEEAGKITAVTVSENDIASANLLGTTASTSGETSAFGYIAKEVVERKAAIQAQKDALDAEIAARKAVDGQSGATYAANSGTNYISGAASLNDADVKLDAAIKAVADTAAKAHTVVNAKDNGHVTVAVAKSADGTHDVVTVSENDIASVTATTAAINAEKSARETEDAKIVAGVGLTDFNGAYKIAANTGTGESISAASTVKQAIYTLDDAITAAKKANTLTKADDTVVVTSGATGTTVKVNIASAETVTNFVGYAADGSFIKSEMFGTIDAGTY